MTMQGNEAWKLSMKVLTFTDLISINDSPLGPSDDCLALGRFFSWSQSNILRGLTGHRTHSTFPSATKTNKLQ